jgi:hypothetical protein
MPKKPVKKAAKKAAIKKTAKKTVKKTAKKAAKKTTKKTAKKAAKKRPAAELTSDQISHAAYLNYIDRQKRGIDGDHTGDWLAAEEQLRKKQS